MRLVEAGALVSKAVVPEACVPALAATFLAVCALPQDPMKSAPPASPDSKPWERPDHTVFTSTHIQVHTHAHTHTHTIWNGKERGDRQSWSKTAPKPRVSLLYKRKEIK